VFFEDPHVARQHEADIQLLDDQHALLRTAIESLPRAAFGDAKKLRQIYGSAAHDVYHAGQIQLIKKLHES